jgi:hypothetical protein
MEERTEERSEQGRIRGRRRDRFTNDMTVREAIDAHPRARWVITSFQFGGCTSCAVSDEETLETVSTTYGLRSGELLAALNELE